MDKHLLRLAAILLDKATDEFASHGCNDFDLVKEGQIAPDKVIEINRAFAKNNDPNNTDELTQEEIDTYEFSDSCLMSWLATILLKGANL